MFKRFLSYIDISGVKSKEWLNFSVFLFISFIMWFFISLSDKYTETVKVKYVFDNMPENKVVIGDLPVYADVEIKASGYELIDYKWFGAVPEIKINVKKDAVIKNNVLSFNAKIIRNLLKHKLGENISILNDRLSNRTYKLSILKQKRIEIIPNIDIDLAAQYQIYDEIKLLPLYVKAYGPKEYLDTLTNVYTVKIKLTNVKESQNFYAKLQKYNSVKLIPDSVKVVVPVDRFTEKIIKVDIDVINKPKNIKIQLLPTFATLRFRVSFSNYQKITAEQFKVVVDYKLIKKSKSNMVKIRLIKHPKDIDNIKLSPKRVEFLLESK